MATGSASRSSAFSAASESDFDLTFINLSTDCETWLTGPEEDQSSSKTISTQEWLDGALTNSQYDHTKLHRIMQSQKKQRKRLIQDMPPHASSLLTSVTEEHDKTNSISDKSLLAPETDKDSDCEEFFDAPATFENETDDYKSSATQSYQNSEKDRKNSSRQNFNAHANTLQSSPRDNINESSLQNTNSYYENKSDSPVLNGNVKHLTLHVNVPKISTRRENLIPLNKTPSPRPVGADSKIPAVNNAMNKSGLRPPLFPRHPLKPNIVKTSSQIQNVLSKSSDLDDSGDVSFEEMSRKVEEQEKKLREEALQGKKSESRPSSSASTNSEAINVDSTTPNLPTSKSVDFKGVERLSIAGRSPATRIPMYGRTASVSSTLNRTPKPRANILTPKAFVAPPSKETSNDPWGDNCF